MLKKPVNLYFDRWTAVRAQAKESQVTGGQTEAGHIFDGGVETGELGMPDFHLPAAFLADNVMVIVSAHLVDQFSAANVCRQCKTVLRLGML